MLLTPREQAVASLVADGLPNREIAQAINVSHRTIETHLQNIFKKLHFTSRTQLAAYWFQEGANIKNNPEVVRVPPMLDEVGWLRAQTPLLF